MTKGNDDTTQQLPAIKTDPGALKTETHPENAVLDFADKVQDLMNYAYHQSQPANGQLTLARHQKFADWCNALGDLWREVKKHV